MRSCIVRSIIIWRAISCHDFRLFVDCGQQSFGTRPQFFYF
jgi:hypothetical protein